MRLVWMGKKLRVQRGKGTEGKGNLKVEIKDKSVLLTRGGNFIAQFFESKDGFSVKLQPLKSFGKADLRIFLHPKGFLFIESKTFVEEGDGFYFLGEGPVSLVFSKDPKAMRWILDRECQIGLFGKVLDGRKMGYEKILRIAEEYDAVIVPSRRNENREFFESELYKMKVKPISPSRVFFPKNPVDALLNIGSKIPVLKVEKLKYEFFKNCEEFGYPVLPLFFRYENTFGIVDEFIVGDLLIAPDVHDLGERWVYLPKGRWLDIEKGEILKEGWNEVEGSDLFLKSGGAALIDGEDHLELIAFQIGRIKKRLLLGDCEKTVEIFGKKIRFFESNGCGRREWLIRIFTPWKIREISIALGDEEKVIEL